MGSAAAAVLDVQEENGAKTRAARAHVYKYIMKYIIFIIKRVRIILYIL